MATSEITPTVDTPTESAPIAGKDPSNNAVSFKRHRKVFRDNIQGITKPAIRRIARRSGIKRISGLMYEETRGMLRVFLTELLAKTLTCTEHANRKTVTPYDVIYALKRQGRMIYGIGM